MQTARLTNAKELQSNTAAYTFMDHSTGWAKKVSLVIIAITLSTVNQPS